MADTAGVKEEKMDTLTNASPASESCASGRVIQATAGDTLLYEYHGKAWPVVICDGETPPDAFMKTKPSGRVLPAILLGKVIYIWVVEQGLWNFENGKDYSNCLPALELDQPSNIFESEKALERIRRNAFAFHAVLAESPRFWKNYIQQRSAARQLEREIAEGRERKRKVAMMKTAPRKRREGGDSPGSSKRRDSVICFSDCDIPTSNKSLSSMQSQRVKNIQWATGNPPKEHECTIFVAEVMEPFRVPVQRLEVLKDLTIFTEELKTHVVLGNDFDIKVDEFSVVAKYLIKADFAPRLIEFDGRQWFKGISSPGASDLAAVSIAKVYRTAVKLHFESLQSLCTRKLKLLDSISQSSLVTVAGWILRADRSDSESDDQGRRLLNYLIMKQKSGRVQQQLATSVRDQEGYDITGQ